MMFGKLRKWLRGKKKNVSINPKQRTRRKDSLRKTKSLHDLELMSQLENDGFRISSMDDFDIIPSAHVHTDGGSGRNANASPISSGVVVDSPLNETNNNNEQLELPKPLPQTNPENTAIQIEDNSPDGSVVDLVTSSREPSNNANPASDELDLSLEMQALDMFDSIVNDIETKQESDAESTAMPPMENDRDPTTDYSISIDPLGLAQPREQQSVDLDQVIGNLDSTTVSKEEENWRISRVEPVRKSLMFRENAMYLPSGRPELPPADYPETEDELVPDDNVSADVESVSNKQSPTHYPTPQSPPQNAKETNEDTEVTKQPERVATTEVSSVTKTDNRTSVNSSSQNHHNDYSQTNGNQKLSTTHTSSANGTAANARHAQTPKKPKPRVTSFKSSGTPPRVKNTHDFGKLVEKFEKL